MTTDKLERASPLTSRAYWDQAWQAHDSTLHYDPEKIDFKDVFRRYVSSDMHCFEVGCFPGRYMLYLADDIGCRVSGVDFVSNMDQMRALFERHGVKPSEIIQADFFTLEPIKQYDFVYSLGFIEHFENFEDVIRHHIKFVRPGGYLFLEVPNFRGPVQYSLHRVFDSRAFGTHHLPAMNLRRWKEVLLSEGMEIIEQRYYGTFNFWVGNGGSLDRFSKFLVKRIIKYGKYIERRLNMPNSWTSAWMISVSRKKP